MVWLTGRDGDPLDAPHAIILQDLQKEKDDAAYRLRPLRFIESTGVSSPQSHRLDEQQLHALQIFDVSAPEVMGLVIRQDRLGHIDFDL